MPKLSHKMLITLSGLIWLALGIFLLQLGLNFIMETAQPGIEKGSENHPLIHAFAAITGDLENGALILIALCLTFGYFKGKYVLGKSANRGIERILTFSNPTSLANIYNARYYILLGSMVFLGIAVRYLPLDIRGGIDVLIGSALINGAIVYFRGALDVHQQAKI